VIEVRRSGGKMQRGCGEAVWDLTLPGRGWTLRHRRRGEKEERRKNTSRDRP